MAHVIEREQWVEKPDVLHGEFQAGAYGADQIGGGPKLHKHPYAEVFVVREGRGLFTIGDKTIEATAGQILVVPADVPHKFSNLGPGRFESTDVHLAGAFITEWLE